MAKEKHFKWLEELNVFLQQFPVKLERNILRGALRQGANVIAAETKLNCPVGEPSDKNKELYGAYAGALKDSIRVGTNAKRGKVTGYVRVGGKTKTGVPVFWAHWVEYGTKPHDNGARGWHPGATRNRPFLRPAADTKMTESVIAVGNRIKLRIEQKNGINIPDVIEAEE